MRFVCGGFLYAGAERIMFYGLSKGKRVMAFFDKNSTFDKIPLFS